MTKATVRGITMIEILVVVAILAVLTAIVLPVVIGARERAREAPTIEALRQVYVGMVLYEEDHDGAPPPSLIDLAPTYLPPTALEHPQDHRRVVVAEDWPANPWVNHTADGELIDHPEDVHRMSTIRNAYFFLYPCRKRFPPGRTYADFRQQPGMGVISGFGLLRCMGGENACSFPSRYPWDRGHPAYNLKGPLFTVRMDGSTTRRVIKGRHGNYSYESLFLLSPLD